MNVDLKVVAAGVATIMTIAGGIAYSGDLMKKLVPTREEFITLAGSVEQLQQEQAQSAIESLELRQLRIQQSIRAAESVGQDTSDLEQENRILEKKKARAEKILDGLLKR